MYPLTPEDGTADTSAALGFVPGPLRPTRGNRPAAPAAENGERRQTVTADVATPTRSSGARVAVQKFGTFLSGMIMPNIAAFIAWGFITAFFIQTGWTPVAGIGGFGT